jgi:hydrogenase 3 maturation protease
MAAPDRLERKLRRSLKGKVVLIGAGNELRSDDGVGAVLAKKLGNRLRATVLDAGSALESFLSPILREAPQTVALIDAVQFDGRKGEVRVFRVADLGTARLGTHGMSPGLFMETLERMGVAHTLLIGIQPGTTTVGQELTPEIQSAAEILEAVLTRILG